MVQHHLTKPHSADLIEQTHHTDSSEGHQVPGPPHSHGHEGHGRGHGAGGGRVVAAITAGLLLLVPAWIGLRAPAVGEVGLPGLSPVGGGAPAGPAAASEPGIVVLTDGRVLTGPLLETGQVVTVQSADGEVVVPRTQVRWLSKEGTTLTDEYWERFGQLPLADPGYARRGGGIVVLQDGRVFVGAVSQGSTSVTVRYARDGVTGEITIPREKVRWVDPSHETLTGEYWRQHGHEPLDEDYRRPDTGERHEGAARPTAPSDARVASAPAARDPLDAATAASVQAYQASHSEADLASVVACARRQLQAGFEAVPQRPTTERLEALLAPIAHVPAVREVLARAYADTARFYLVFKQLDAARRWASALRELGGEHVGEAQYLFAAASNVQRGVDEEAEEEEEEGEGEHAREAEAGERRF
jgi:hypothetical protein